MRSATRLILALTLLVQGVLAGLAHGHHRHDAHLATATAEVAFISDALHAGHDEPATSSGSSGTLPDCGHGHCQHTPAIGSIQHVLAGMPRGASIKTGRAASLTSRAIPVHQRPPRLALA